MAVEPASSRPPVAFISHGTPMVAVDDDDFSEALRTFGARVPTPAAIVVATAGWRTPGAVRVSVATQHRSLRDFRGGPPALGTVDYRPPGSRELALEIIGLLKERGFEAFPDQVRGLEPSTWIPLSLSHPQANVPVVQLSIPDGTDATALVSLGAALSPLRERDVLLVASGGSGNQLDLRQLPRKHAPVKGWAREFDAWVAQHLEPLDVDALVDYQQRAPHADQADPGSLPFAALLVALGAAEAGEVVRTLYAGLHHEHLSLRSFTIGPA